MRTRSGSPAGDLRDGGKQAGDGHPERAPSGVSATASVLVVDARDRDRELLSLILQCVGYTTVEARSATAAIELARSERPDAIVAEVEMPDMDGYELVRALRRDESLRDTPVVFCTSGRNLSEARGRGKRCGVTRALRKPCEPEELARTLREVLGTARKWPAWVESKTHPELRLLNRKLFEQLAELEVANDSRERDEELHRAVVDNMVEGLCVVDREGRVLVMNPAAADLLGWTQEELIGRRAHDIVHSQRASGTPLPPEECELLAASREGRALRSREDVFTRKDGSILPVSYSVAPLSDGSSTRGAVVVFRDLTAERTDFRQAQQELDAVSTARSIREALEEGRLELYSQPIVRLAGGAPHEELLLRMIDRDGEVIAAGAFLPAAEKYGLVGEIDRWVVTEAIRRAAGGRRVQLNLSAHSLGDPELLALIEEQLDETQADPADVVFEITETALMHDIDAGEAFARDLTALGCELALDDFGTGFGSFTYLKRLPISYLKIDVEFVRNLGSNPANQHLVKAIVNLAQGFGHETIAEGVEDEETLALLRDYGVDYAQGFHLGIPAPACRSGALRAQLGHE